MEHFISLNFRAYYLTKLDTKQLLDHVNLDHVE